MYNQPDWRNYEDFIAQMLKACGWINVKQCALGPDEGVDVTAIAPDGFRKMLVQCKFYSNRVGSDYVQKLAGWVGRDNSFTDYVLVTPVGYTDEAKHWAKQMPDRRLKLMTTDEFAKYIGFDMTRYIMQNGGNQVYSGGSNQVQEAFEFVGVVLKGIMFGISMYIFYWVMYIAIFVFVVWFFVSCTYDAFKMP